MSRPEIEDRHTPFTRAEFDALERNDRGDIVELFQCFMWLKPEQIELLTGDDQSRVDDYEEEVRILMAQAKEEFGL